MLVGDTGFDPVTSSESAQAGLPVAPVAQSEPHTEKYVGSAQTILTRSLLAPTTSAETTTCQLRHRCGAPVCSSPE